MFISAEVSTKNRYDILYQCLLSVVNQTYKINELILFDDNDNPTDLRNIGFYKYIFQKLDSLKIEWKVVFGAKKGQHYNHQTALDLAKGDWIWRIDDDDIFMPNCLENMVKHIKPNTGAIGPYIIHKDILNDMPKSASSKIEDIYARPNCQWFKGDKTLEVEHLNNTFMFKKELGKKYGFDLSLSKVAHREETMFTYNIFKQGYRCLYEPSRERWHLKSNGGIRSSPDLNMFNADEAIFSKFIRNNNIRIKNYKFLYLMHGLGDCLIFRSEILPSMKGDLVICSSWSDVFNNISNVLSISTYELNFWEPDTKKAEERWNFYKFCGENRKSQHISLSMKEFYK